jgi:zinc transporter 5/7
MALGRVLSLPLVYLCFSLFMIIRLPLLELVQHTLLLSSFIVFYWPEAKSLLGFDSSQQLITRYSYLFEVGRSPQNSSQPSLVVDFLRACYENSDTRKIAIFFLINLSFMFVELLYGYLSNSLGLISDSFHMLFDCMALFIGLCASYIA